MRIAMIMSTNLPMPPVMGGAVQELAQSFIDATEGSGDSIVCFSPFSFEAKERGKNFSNTKYEYVKLNSLITKTIHKGIKKVSHLLFLLREKKYIKRIISSLKKCQFDLILLENCPHYARFLKREFPNCKVVLHLHNEWLYSTAQSNQDYHSIDKVICVSNFIKNKVKQKYPELECVTIHNGIKGFGSLNGKKEESSFGFSSKDLVVLFAARLVKEKGALELLQGAAGTRNKEHIKILILGSKLYGENVADAYLTQLKSTIADCGMTSNVYFAGFVPHDQICNYLSLADVGALPSIWDDPCPLTILEYLSAGLPIITTFSGGIPELVDSDCAFVFKRDNLLSKHISNALDQLYESKKLLIAMGQHSKEIFASFGLDNYLRALKSELERSI